MLRSISKIAVITSRSELEYSARRNPRVRDHAGECSSAYSAIFCFSSDSRPVSSTGLDSGEPRCTSQTVRKM